MTLLAEPRPVTAADITDAELDGAWIVDVREETPVAAPTSVAPYVGYLVPWEDDIVLLAGSPDVLSPRSGSPWR